jgi:hypothetical protein
MISKGMLSIYSEQIFGSCLDSAVQGNTKFLGLWLR